ncbi:hypothetical protein BDA99DRAFT_578448 [Phascolomyces articulosus]|uniref:Uncharacterized protein n=1 Tax=Phascolomyces articulosus TaxID=60185 RepID=A0AAD5KCU6_9FUNG|nr:hypothetical protein BDA99DRAFT_578448 [Phascolomyces articulosus]
MSDYLSHHGLYIVGQTLTELRLSSISMVNVPLAIILSSCRNLASLDLNVKSVATIELTQLSHTTALRAITLNLTYPMANPDELLSLFRHSPYIRFFYLVSILMIRNMTEDILPTLYDYCPKLTTFAAQGVQYLMTPWNTPVRTLLPHFEKSKSTLKTMHLIPAYNANDSSNSSSWGSISTIDLPILTNLNITIPANENKILRYVSTMLYSYPSLERLELESCSLVEDDTMDFEVAEKLYTAIAQLAKLTYLSFHTLTITKENTGPLIHFLQHLARKFPEYGALQDLRFNFCPGIRRNVLLEIAKIKSFEKLYIFATGRNTGTERNTGTLTGEDFALFAELISKLPKLTNLFLGNMEMTEEAAKYLAANTTLTNLNLFGTPGANTLKVYNILVENIENVEIDD